ncbi:hypothetical protein VNO80_30583 [Phaseolus coccineus]|uniref:Uncharacterized protein n=1 Tax=Phaseolus coccineus TaxID=3886 RepID=A0AAN9LGK3_PHACN
MCVRLYWRERGREARWGDTQPGIAVKAASESRSTTQCRGFVGDDNDRVVSDGDVGNFGPRFWTIDSSVLG